MRASSFLKDRSGNFALYTALVILPLIGMVGMAVDYYALTEEQKALQNAVDSAVLAVAANATKLDDAQAEQLARDYIGSTYSGKLSTLSVKQDGETTMVSAAADADLVFNGLFGGATRRIAANASAEQAFNDYEIGLVLDTTGSMEGAKLAALKAAATAMIDDMSTEMKGKGTLKFALVPFSTFVNVGPQYGPQFDANGNLTKSPARWLDTYALSPVKQNDLDKFVNRFVLYKNMNLTWPGCVETRQADAKGAYDVEDIVPNPLKPETLFVPSFNPDEPDDPWMYPNSYVADGVAGVNQGTLEQRMQRYGAPAVAQKPNNIIAWIKYILSWKKVAINASASNFYSNYFEPMGPTFNCDTQPITPLTSDYALLKDNISKLEALGSTNILEGAMWGWRVLSSREPFTEGAAEGKKGNQKVMVLLTDGTNSFGNLPNALGSAYTSFGYLVDERIGPATLDAQGTTNAMDAKTLAACTNAKKDGIEIYTILLEEDNAKTSALLEQCASGADHYFNVPDHSKLKAVFTDIVKKVGKLRLAS